MLYHSLFSPSKLKSLLNQYHIIPKKSLGQNFLIDKNIVEKIINAVDIRREDVVVEVGAGLGELTYPFARCAQRVIAYEIDGRLIPILREVVSEFPNVEIREEDILEQCKMQNAKCKIESQNVKSDLLLSNYIVVGNLPYYITSRVLRQFLGAEHKPQRMIVTVQKEVAERIVAKPPNMSLLSVMVQFYGVPRIVARVSRNCFWPKPKVDSAVVRIETKGTEPFRNGSVPFGQRFFSLVKAGFAKKRKLLASNLCREKDFKSTEDLKSSLPNSIGNFTKADWEEVFQKTGIPKNARAQELSVEEWKKLEEFVYCGII